MWISLPEDMLLNKLALYSHIHIMRRYAFSQSARAVTVSNGTPRGGRKNLKLEMLSAAWSIVREFIQTKEF